MKVLLFCCKGFETMEFAPFVDVMGWAGNACWKRKGRDCCYCNGFSTSKIIEKKETSPDAASKVIGRFIAAK